MGIIGINIDRLEKHQPDYYQNSWEEYSFQELGSIVSFFAKRAIHRANEEKAKKDLYDAKNYLAMMIEKLSMECKALGINFEEL